MRVPRAWRDGWAVVVTGQVTTGEVSSDACMTCAVEATITLVEPAGVADLWTRKICCIQSTVFNSVRELLNELYAMMCTYLCM